MTPAIKTISDIYTCMEQGNIGKLLVVLDSSINVQTAECLGGTKPGAEGILQLISMFYRPGVRIKKMVKHIVEHHDKVIVLGNIQTVSSVDNPNQMPFADVWSFENNKIREVVFYYRDPGELCGHLNAI